MSSSGLSDLSSPLSTDDELASAPIRPGSLDAFFKHRASGAKQSSPPAKKKREPSPPHDYVLADNADIAFIVMFRSRFSDAFPKSLPHYGPQDIERGVAEALPDEQVERLLCALLGLVLNRKKDVERGHFQRALEEAVQTHVAQWPSLWKGSNPLHGGGNFNNMTPEQRLTLLKTLIIWSLGSSEAVQAILKESYKQQRHEDDLNQPLSIQPWGRDGDKRRFWLIEGQDDTHFRLYRESNPVLKHNTWRSVAGSIDELKDVAARLGEEGSQASKRLHDRILNAIPRFEASEDKRKRRDYRLARKAQFTRPELGFSIYEGRTRGKRMKYTFSDEEEGGSDAPSTRRSHRYSGASTPAEAAGPVFTASGRQVRSRHGGAYGETMLESHQDKQAPSAARVYDGPGEADGAGVATRGRTRGTSRNESGQRVKSRSNTNGIDALGAMDDESDATSSGEEWDGGNDDDDDEIDEQLGEEESHEDTDLSDDNNSDELEDINTDRQGSLIVSLRYKQKKPEPPPALAPIPAQARQTSGSASDETSSLPLTNGHHLGSAGSITDNLSPSQPSTSTTEELSQTNADPRNMDKGFTYPSKQTNPTYLSTDVTMA
ncbi:MAG: hypothetical protein Q9195_002567 [Heterodermia aff. obscurata]